MKSGMSNVYRDRPGYADYEPARKFTAIESIIAKRLKEHPNATCSYSGGSDSDIMLDLVERTRKIFNLPPIHYVFFNTGLEMKATRNHVKEVAAKYGIDIKEERPKINIVQAARKYGIPFVSKIMSAGLDEWQKKGVPISIADEYDQAEDKAMKRKELRERYPKCESLINFLCCCKNDEFSLEAAYHDCKLVFDGITDDDSFQEADTGLILYYANEIIYALQEAIEGKDTNVHSSCSDSPNGSTLQQTCNQLATDTISRQAAIEALDKRFDDIPTELTTEILLLRNDLRERIPSTEPEQQWIPCRERLPEYDGEMYLVTDYCEQINRRRIHFSRCYVNREGFWSDVPVGYKVIAWMPLPKPYREENR